MISILILFGQIFLFAVPGLGVGIRDMWCAGWGMIRIARDVVIMYVRVLNHVSGRRAKMLIVNCR